MIKEYVKTAPIHAIQWTGMAGNTEQIISWARQYGVEIVSDFRYFGDDPDEVGERVLRIPTLEGPMTASVGDHIAKGVNNEFWAIKPDIMAKTYQEVGVRPTYKSTGNGAMDRFKEI